MKLVQAWNRKWHLHEEDLRVEPEVPEKWITCDGTTMRIPARGRILPPHEDTYPHRGNCWVCRRGGRALGSPKPQPERKVALTTCGEEVYLRDERDGTPNLKSSKFCDRCRPVAASRLRRQDALRAFRAPS